MVRSVSIFILLLLSVALSYYSIFKTSISETPSKIIQSDCHLSDKTCLIQVDSGYILNIDLKPKPLPIMEPFVLVISGGNESLTLQKAWFEGRDMNMGKHYLLPGDTGQKMLGGQVQIELKGIIPVCHIDESMTWRVIIELLYKKERIQIHLEQNIASE